MSGDTGLTRLYGDPAPTAEPDEHPLAGLLPNLNDPAHTRFADAARVLTDPAIAVAARVEAARAEGHAAGYAAGTAAAHTASAQLAEHVVAVVSAAADQVAQTAAAALATQAGELAEAAWQLARWAVGRELDLDPAALTGAVTAAVAEIDAAVELVVYAHPGSAAALADWVASYSPHPLVLRPDPGLAPGELRVEAATGARVEATVAEIGRRALARLVGTSAAARPDTQHPHTGHPESGGAS